MTGSDFRAKLACSQTAGTTPPAITWASRRRVGTRAHPFAERGTETWPSGVKRCDAPSSRTALLQRPNLAATPCRRQCGAILPCGWPGSDCWRSPASGPASTGRLPYGIRRFPFMNYRRTKSENINTLQSVSVTPAKGMLIIWNPVYGTVEGSCVASRAQSPCH